MSSQVEVVMGRRSVIIVTELGPERQCGKCGEFWPDDREFFYMQSGKIRQPCKACYEALPSVIAKRARQRKHPRAEA